MLLTHVTGLIYTTTRIAADWANQWVSMSNPVALPASMFNVQTSHLRLHAIVRDLELAVTQSMPGIFAHAPSSYTPATETPDNQKCKSGPNNAPVPNCVNVRSDQTKGWIL